MASHAAALERVKNGLSAIELLYTSHSKWPHRPDMMSSSPLRISVLDSSFNPPTLAHLALLDAPAPNNLNYDAKLLLLSVRNADKVLKPSDATYNQRLQMMVLLAQDVDASKPHPVQNVAVAIIDEPVFVRKSSILRTFLNRNMSSMDSGGIQNGPDPRIPPISLYFLMGLDTVTRLLTPSYYSDPMLQTLHRFFSAAPDGDGCRVVCANRSMSSLGVSSTDTDVKAKLELGRAFLASGHIAMIDLPEGLEKLSSSEIRQKIERNDSGWKGMVTGRVAVYLEEHGLYRSLSD